LNWLLVKRGIMKNEILLFILMLTSAVLAKAEVQVVGPEKLISDSDIIAVLKLTKTIEPGQIALANIIAIAKGKIDSNNISFLYPKPNIEEMSAHIPPQEGTVLLAFLKKLENDTYIVSGSQYLKIASQEDAKKTDPSLTGKFLIFTEDTNWAQ
jgi:hypothetical protein